MRDTVVENETGVFHAEQTVTSVASAILQAREHAVRRVPVQGQRAPLRSGALPRRDDRRPARARARGGRRGERHPGPALRARARARLGRLRARRAAPALAGRRRGGGGLPRRRRRDRRASTPTTLREQHARAVRHARRCRTRRCSSSARADDPEREAATNVLLAGSEAVATSVRRDLGLSTSVGDLQDKVQVEAEQNANVLKITASDERPAPGGRDRQRLRREFIAFRARGDRRASRPPQRDLQSAARRAAGRRPRAAGPARLAPAPRLAAHALANGDARVIAQGHRAHQPLQPRAQAGARAGRHPRPRARPGRRAGRRVDGQADRRRGQLRARVPAARAGRRPAEGVPAPGPRSGSGDLEPFRILRTAVDFAQVTRPVRTVMVTSAVRGEGKIERGDRAGAGDRAQRPPGDPRRARPAPSDAGRARSALPDQGGVTSALLGSDPNELLQRPLTRAARPRGAGRRRAAAQPGRAARGAGARRDAAQPAPGRPARRS